MARLFAFAILLASLPSAALADARDFVIINGTEVALGDLTIRRAGTESWKPLASSPAAGANQNVKFADPDCAFDIQATVKGAKPMTWAGVNLCDVKSVTLKSDSVAGQWVDYDER